MDTLNVVEAAEVMKTHPSTVYELIQDGALPAGRIGRQFVILRKDVMNLIEQQIIKQTAERMRRPARLPELRDQGART